ncbi:Anaphase-promoting complex subunit 23 [Kappamyces sp. JEL0829]|nr:Anaphase-promoting complex subunit 23 [Kappamyces sp. JEL0829]
MQNISLLLQQSINDCNERGLVNSSKWAAEQLFGWMESGQEILTEKSRDRGTIEPHFVYAKALFDAREYARASNVLKTLKDQKSLFVRHYARFLYIQSLSGYHNEINLCVGSAPARNQEEMQDILKGIEEIHDKDAFLLYLYGVVCLELKMHNKAASAAAKESLLESLRMYPYNWSCWLALSEFCDKPNSISELTKTLPHSFPLDCWKIQVLNELHSAPDNVVPVLDHLAATIPQSRYLLVQRAVLYHNARDFEESESLFESLHSLDPYLIDSMDLYSNVLYVRRNYSKLCDLAHTMSMTDRFRPETCVCVGNYYSMKGDRKKAIEAFSRALQLDHNYSPAWTLLGHEYVDSCNPKAAVEVYRKAIDINPRDYRAWYGLGQAYDLLQLPSYSIYYHQRAISIRPNDGRMWGALAASLEATGKLHESIKCLKRVMLSLETSEPPEYGKCAQLYSRLYSDEGNSKYEASAVFYYRKYLFEHARLAEISNGEFVDEANAFLYKYHRSRGEADEAEKYAE